MRRALFLFIGIIVTLSACSEDAPVGSDAGVLDSAVNDSGVENPTIDSGVSDSGQYDPYGDGRPALGMILPVGARVSWTLDGQSYVSIDPAGDPEVFSPSYEYFTLAPRAGLVCPSATLRSPSGIDWVFLFDDDCRMMNGLSELWDLTSGGKVAPSFVATCNRQAADGTTVSVSVSVLKKDKDGDGKDDLYLDGLPGNPEPTIDGIFFSNFPNGEEVDPRVSGQFLPDLSGFTYQEEHAGGSNPTPIEFANCQF